MNAREFLSVANPTPGIRSPCRISPFICISIYFGIELLRSLIRRLDHGRYASELRHQNADSTIGQLLNDIVQLSHAIHLLLVFPIMNFTLRANIDEIVLPKKPRLASDRPRFVSLTLVLLLIASLMAIAISDVRYFFQFMGSTTLVCLSFMFPAAIILRDVYGLSTTRDKIVAMLVIIWQS